MSGADDRDEAAFVRVVAGRPTPEELAAVVAVLAAVATAGDGDGTASGAAPASQWTSRERGVRIGPRPSRGGWRASAFPPAV